MNALQFVFFPHGGQASIKQKSVCVPDNHMIVTREQVSFEGLQSSCFGFTVRNGSSARCDFNPPI
jgi:hypothetical protein